MLIPSLSANQLEVLFQSFPESLCLLHFEGTFVKVNPAFAETSGYSNRELVDRKFTDFVHPHDRKYTVEVLGRMRFGEAACKFENRFEFKNSQYKRLLWNCYTIRQNELFYCSAIDISEKTASFRQPGQSESANKAAEPLSINPVKESKDDKILHHQWMDNIIENYTDGFFTLNRNWTVKAFNQKAQRMVDLPEPLINKNFWSLFPVGTDHQLFREAKRSLEKNQTVHFEEFYPHLNKWLEITAYPYQDTVTLFFKDTTIRKNQEIDLQHLAEDYKILFANNPLPMWAYDLDQLKILMVNNAALSLYGYTREEFLALNLYDLRPEVEHERLRQELKDKYLYHPLKLSSEWQHKKKDGSIIYVDIASHMIKLSEHRARLIVANNITERRRVQTKLLSQNKQLREIAQLSSHELRGPIASILGLVSLFDENNTNFNLNNRIIKNLERCAKDMDKVIHAIVKKTYEDGI
jgi:PAS domain S-box-containing protein